MSFVGDDKLTQNINGYIVKPSLNLKTKHLPNFQSSFSTTYLQAHEDSIFRDNIF